MQLLQRTLWAAEEKMQKIFKPERCLDTPERKGKFGRGGGICPFSGSPRGVAWVSSFVLVFVEASYVLGRLV